MGEELNLRSFCSTFRCTFVNGSVFSPWRPGNEFELGERVLLVFGPLSKRYVIQSAKSD